MGWHKYVVHRNPESGAVGMLYRECRRCGKEKDYNPGSPMTAI
jgi:hypothetical protein